MSKSEIYQIFGGGGKAQLAKGLIREGGLINNSR